MTGCFQATATKWISDQVMIDETPRVVAYRLGFELDRPKQITLHVSADERYELFLNGERVGRGPERGDRLNWFYESYKVDLPAGPHMLVALTWWLGSAGCSPFAQMTVRHAFVLCAEGENAGLLNTGHANWSCKRLGGYHWLPTGQAWGCGAKVRVTGSEVDWDATLGQGNGWQATHAVGEAVSSEANDRPLDWRLRPAVLPPMAQTSKYLGTVRLVADASEFPFHDDPYQLQPPVSRADHLPDEAAAWQSLLAGGRSVTVPKHSSRRVLIDLDDYFCAYPDVKVTDGRGALLRLSWAEALYERLPIAEKREWIGFMPKGNRDMVEGKFFHGVTDEFLPDGSKLLRNYTTFWWQAGRYVQLLIRTEDDAVTVNSISWRVTHYPFSLEHSFECSDPRLEKVNQLALRTLLMGSHEHYTDSPYYEQLQYVGDTRLESLTTYAITRDSRLPSKAVELLDQSRLADGMIQSRYPSRVTQYILGFDLWWVAMVHDWMMWRGDRSYVAARLPGVRAALDAALKYLGRDNVIHMPARPNFTFIDWGKEWDGGHPKSNSDITALVTWQLVHVLGLAAEIEDYAGEPEMAKRWTRQAKQVATAASQMFWCEDRGLMSDDQARSSFSEHTQILALLSSQLSADHQSRVLEGLLQADGLHRATIYFTHYLFEVCHRFDRARNFYERLQTWFDLLNRGLKALPEMPEPTRSDCHAWGSHVVYHCLTSMLGVRPSSPGFASVEIRPMLGPLIWAKGVVPHPHGDLSVELNRMGQHQLAGSVFLPGTLQGTLFLGSRSIPLMPGLNVIQPV